MAGVPELREGWRQTPHPRRLPVDAPSRDEIISRHADAVDGGQPVYTDPVSGLGVFTAEFLAQRAYCCESGCRHCPYIV